MLESVVSAVIRALGAVGLEAVGAYPKRELCHRESPLVCVGVKSARGLPAGFGAYLGLGVDPVTGLGEELYGARCELEISLDIYAWPGAENGAEECMRCAGLVGRSLGELPEGIRISSVSFGQAGFDGETGMFRCSGAVSGAAYFVARAADGDGGFTDFILRGSVKE